ncbi:MAG TPA: hypothetical protein VF377_14215 [Acidimicrobiia bacterium]|jgi:hypothetical protein
MHVDYHLAKALDEGRLLDAQAGGSSRLRRQATKPRSPSTGVIDALGHGLIAIGTRLVSDPDRHESHEPRAA